MVTITIGPAVKDADFYDREKLIKEIGDILEKGSVLLKAPRRTGKTSLLLHLEDEPRDFFDIVYITVEDLSDPHHVVSELIYKASLKKKDGWGLLKRMVSTTVGNINEVEVWQFKLKLREHLEREWRASGRDRILDSIRLCWIYSWQRSAVVGSRRSSRQ